MEAATEAVAGLNLDGESAQAIPSEVRAFLNHDDASATAPVGTEGSQSLFSAEENAGSTEKDLNDVPSEQKDDNPYKKNKYFLVTNDMANPIYCDHPMSRLIFGPAAMVYLYANFNLNEYFRCIRCGDSIIVGQRFCESLILIVVSNGGESEHFLRRQLYIIYDLLRLRLSPQLINTVAQRDKHKVMNVYQKAMHQMIDTYDYLCDHQQSHLVQSIEWLEINEDIRTRCQAELERGINMAPAATHAILFSGTKVVAISSKARAFELLPSDLCLIIIYLQSLFNPKTKKREVFEMPVANYHMDFAENQEQNEFEAEEHEPPHDPEEISNIDDDDGFESASEGYEKDPNHDQETSPATNVTSPSTNQASEPQTRSQPVGIPQPATSSSENMAESMPMATPAGSFIDYTSPENTASKVPPMQHSAQSSRHPAPNSSLPRPSLDQIPGSASNPALDTSEEKETTKFHFENLYLRSPQYVRCCVYSSELTDSTTLVIINPGSEGTEEEKKRLHAVRKHVLYKLRTYMSFIETRGDTHITMLSFLHMFPGLVHFIFVDRTNNTVIAPAIIPLHGQQHDMQDPAAIQSVKLIKGKVWDMCYKAQRQLSLGFTSTIMKLGDFQYSYKLWVEDAEGNEQPVPNPIPSSQIPIESSSYTELMKRLFPNQRGYKMYELYALYVGMLPSAAVVSHNKRLYTHITTKGK